MIVGLKRFLAWHLRLYSAHANKSPRFTLYGRLTGALIPPINMSGHFLAHWTCLHGQSILNISHNPSKVIQQVDLGQLLNMHPLCLTKVSIAFIMIFNQTPVGPHSLDYRLYNILVSHVQVFQCKTIFYNPSLIYNLQCTQGWIFDKIWIFNTSNIFEGLIYFVTAQLNLNWSWSLT